MENNERAITLEGLTNHVLSVLDWVYHFHPSSRGLYAPQRSALTNGRMPDELLKILSTLDIPNEQLANILSAYSSDKEHGTTFHTKGKYMDADYMIVVPWPPARMAELPFILAEEIMHGEHMTEHEKERYVFSQTANEFFGALGKYNIAERFPFRIRDRAGKEIPPREYLDIAISGKALFNRESGIPEIDFHLIAYAIGRQAFGRVPEAELFHTPDEREMWKLLNRSIVPEITIPVIAEDVDGIEDGQDAEISGLDEIGLEYKAVVRRVAQKPGQ